MPSRAQPYPAIPLKIVFAGTPQFAAIMLDAVMAAGHDVVCVLTQPDRPAGRGRKIHPSPVKMVAERHGLMVLQPTALGDCRVSDTLSAVRADAMVVAAYGLIVPRTLLGLPRLGCINVHASLLPRWRGAAPIQHALLAGDAVTGITIMQMDEGLDTGPILLQGSLAIAPDDTAGTLHDKLAGMGARLLVEALARRPKSRPQDAALATHAPKITRALAEIRWSGSATLIERQVRAFNPVPGAHTQWGGVELKLWRAQVESGSPGVPGQVCAAGAQGIVIACGEGAVRVLELQRAGGRPLAAGAFVAGSGIRPGMNLGR